jgi:hypothetical protein
VLISVGFSHLLFSFWIGNFAQMEVEQYDWLTQIRSTLSDKFCLDLDYATKAVAFCQIICFFPNPKSHLAFRVSYCSIQFVPQYKRHLAMNKKKFSITLDGCYFNLKCFSSDSKVYWRSGVTFLIGWNMLTWR